MHASTLLLAAARGALVLGAALAVMPLLRGASAALRRGILVAAFGAVVALPVVSAALPSLHVPVPILTRLDAPLVAPSPRPDSVARAMPVAPSTTATAARPAPPRETWSPSAGQVVLTVWALGALAVLARFAAGLARARALARGSRLVATERVRGRTVQVRVSREVETPAVTGLLAPVILLPHDAPSWTDERRTIVLLHERAHIERRDTLASAVAAIACALHWFNPLAWLAARRLRFERERAADDRVVESGVRPSCYAEHLLALATVHADATVPAGALAMAERSSVEDRIVALLVPERPRAPIGRLRAVLLVGGAATLLVAVACATPDATSAPVASSPSSAARIERRSGAPLDTVAPSELTLDPALQAIAEEETDRMAAEWKPRSAAVIVLDPATGAVLAMTSRAADRTEVGTQRAFYPGSTMKPFVVAAALDERAIVPSQRFDCATRAYGTESLHDHMLHGTLALPEILVVSSNVGMSRVYDELGGAKLIAWTKRFHFGEAPPTLPFPGVAGGSVPSALEDRSMRGAMVAIGEGLTATPIQVAAAFAAIANGGVYHAPTLVRRAATGPGERVLREETARTVLTMLEGVVDSDVGTGNAARVPGVRVAGKTGTADQHPDGPADDATYASFVGAAPSENPRYVVLVGAEVVGEHAWGGNVAAPVFARIVTRALATARTRPGG
jgi:beta-lactamase regulating signal transducer with metallopeptidase domain